MGLQSNRRMQFPDKPICHWPTANRIDAVEAQRTMRLEIWNYYIVAVTQIICEQKVVTEWTIHLSGIELVLWHWFFWFERKANETLSCYPNNSREAMLLGGESNHIHKINRHYFSVELRFVINCRRNANIWVSLHFAMVNWFACRNMEAAATDFM